jgi:muramoyltetrapeptide carboxypeptidase
MDLIYPRKLRRGDEIRVVAPSASRAMVTEHDHVGLAEGRFARLGVRLGYGGHVDERDARDSSSVASRIYDLHDAFADPSVSAVLTVIGGFNCNELLPHLDFDLIRANPKIFCGYSDTTALHNAILARSGLVTYNGPAWATFGMRDHFEQTLQWFAATLMSDDPVTIRPSPTWTDDLWFLDQDARTVLSTDGWWTVHPGRASGQVVGGNLCTLNLLQGTPFMPSPADCILMVEDDLETYPNAFARDLSSLLQVPEARSIRALVIGRFQRESGIRREMLEQILSVHPWLATIPVVANVDFGHTTPLATLPIGGQATIDTSGPSITLTEH